MFAQFHMPALMIRLKQQQFALIINISLHFFRVHNNNCSTDLYNRDVQTTIILFTQDLLNFFSIHCMACLAFYNAD